MSINPSSFGGHKWRVLSLKYSGMQMTKVSPLSIVHPNVHS